MIHRGVCWAAALAVVLGFASVASADLAPIFPPEPEQLSTPSNLQIGVVALMVMTSLELCVWFALRSLSTRFRLIAVMTVGPAVLLAAFSVYLWAEDRRETDAKAQQAHEAEVERIKESHAAARSRNRDLREQMHWQEPPADPAAAPLPASNASPEQGPEAPAESP
ncbi:hypothetical protein [Lignipirellula cremea]|uniref:Uncharacterized protein n=1 Tax=Lignipirellula cremea TaxID=2528010 RepID=A0A518E318_9BACT|nr:hypothetical protein [Lignipirellula cremea]QDU98453.1 hypothetical protein Pla8534_63210 [Lignipirellula cremea]